MPDDSHNSASSPERHEHPVVNDTPTSAHAPASTRHPTHAELLGESPGEMLGNYQLLRVIGEGGFGVVWLAMQREPVVRQVALKVLKPGMDSRQVLARFEQERQALALMDHPCVAKVFDAGATPTGRPYFVMEYVRGISITGYCDEQRLSLQDRLRLFIPVCEAIQHAHVKGIIHRDIKPSNVLVEVTDGAASVKVIDFGVAKAIEHALTEKTLFTEAGQIVGTPEYMSPEQADADHRRVDTRTDVYALGVMLYELLTGSLPFDPETLRSAGYREIQRIIREMAPPKPSARVSALGPMAGAAAEARRTRATDLSGLLRQELEWIPLRAMRKEPDARYQSAAALAADVRAYLEGLPLAAGPESRAYRVKKFARRHRAGVAAAGAMAALALCGVGALTWGLVQNREAARNSLKAAAESRRALESSKSAERESRLAFDRLRHTSAFLGELLSLADPTSDRRFAGAEQASAEEVTVRAALEAAASRIDDGALDSEPLVEADVREIIGDAFTSIGHAERARAQLRRAIAIRSGQPPVDELRIAGGLIKLARLEVQQRNVDDAAHALERATGILERQSDPPGALLGRAQALRGRVHELRGEYDESRAAYTRAIDTLRPQNADRESEHLVAEVQSMLGVLELRSGNVAQAVTLQREAASVLRRLRGEESAAYATALVQLGAALRQSDALDESERTLRRSVDVWRQITPSGSGGLSEAQGALARLFIGQSRFSEAEPLVNEVLEYRRRHFGNRSLQLADSLDDLGLILRSAGLLDEAIGAYREALSIRRERQGEEHIDTAILLVALADTMNQRGQGEEALPLAELAVRLRSRALPAEHWSVMSARSVLGGVPVRLRRFDEAEQHLLDAERAFRGAPGGSPKRLIDTRTRLVELYEQWGKPEQVATWREMLMLGGKDSTR